MLAKIWCQLGVANAALTGVHLAIYADNAGVPGTLLTSGTVSPNPTGTGLFSADVAPVSLVSGTTYHLAVSGTGEQVDLQGTSSANGHEGAGNPSNPWSNQGGMAATPIIWGEDAAAVPVLPPQPAFLVVDGMLRQDIRFPYGGFTQPLPVSAQVDVTVDCTGVPATATASAPAPIPEIRLLPAAALATATAPAPGLSVDTTVNAPPATATASRVAPVPEIRLLPAAGTATASAVAPVLEVRVTAPPASATASFPAPGFSTASSVPPAVATASAPVPVIEVRVVAPPATATASAPAPIPEIRLLPAPGIATASAPVPTISTSGSTTVTAVPAIATAGRVAPIPEVRIIVELGSYLPQNVPFILGEIAVASRVAPAPEIRLLPPAATATATAPAGVVSIGFTLVAVPGLAIASRVAPTVSITGAISFTVIAVPGLAVAAALPPRIRKLHHYTLVPEGHGHITLYPDESTGAQPHPLEPVIGSGSLTMGPDVNTGG